LIKGSTIILSLLADGYQDYEADGSDDLRGLHIVICCCLTWLLERF
jgi:hypothetical protein